MRCGLILLVVLLTVRLLGGVDSSDLEGRINDLGWGMLSLAVGALLVRLALWDWRWRRGIAAFHLETTMTRTLPALLGGMLVNHVTPTARLAGGLFRARHGVPRSQAGASTVLGTVLFDQLLHQVVSISATMLALAVMAAVLRRWVLFSVALGVLLVAVVVVVWRPRSGRRTGVGVLIRGLVDRIGRRPRGSRLVEGGRQSIRVLRQLLKRRRLVVGNLMLAVSMVLLLAGSVEWIAAALAVSWPWWWCILAVALGTTAGGLLGTPGGVGGVEAGMVLTLTLLGAIEADAVVVTVLFRGVHYALVIGLGLGSLLLCEWRYEGEPSPSPDA